MIKLRLSGRLGNQLFIYAFARSLYDKTGKDVLIYDHKDEQNIFFHSHLDAYKLNEHIRFTSDYSDIMKMSVKRKLLYFIDRAIAIIYKEDPVSYKLFEERWKNFYIKNGLYLMKNGYSELMTDNLPEELFCDGYFQSELFFQGMHDILLNDLTVIKPLNPTNDKLIKDISTSESVCLSIRLGDYVNNPIHDICSIDYYLDAMDLMKKKIPDCQFFVFSDDIEEVKKNFPFNYKVIYQNEGNPDYENLRIMSFCRHFIIPNSSFSWWAQYLSFNSNKIVIAPKRWYVTDIPCDIYQKGWLLL